MIRLFDFEVQEELTFETPPPGKIERACRIGTMCHRPSQGLTLRRLTDDEMAYDSAGKFFETVVILPNHKGTAIRALTGFRADELLSGQFGGAIGYQLSNDDGVTWRAFDTISSSWVPAVGAFASVYVNSAVVEEFIDLFPLTIQRQVRIKVRLTPSLGQKKRPVLRAVVLQLHCDYDFLDDVARSLKAHLEGTTRVRLRWVENLSAAATLVVDSGLRVAGPVEVFNLTADPGKTMNLFVSVLPDGKTVTLSGPQTGKVEVNYFGIPDVFISADQDYQTGKVPTVLINNPTVVDRPRDAASATNESEVEVNRGKKEARVRHRRNIFDANIVIACQAPFKHVSLAMADAVEKAFHPRRKVRSLSIGELLSVVTVGPKAQLDQVTRGLYVTNVPCLLNGHAWLRPEPELVPIAEEITLTLRRASGPGTPEEATAAVDCKPRGVEGGGFRETF
jgi:hypothetical protein